jgi:hypothetical protein
VCASAGGMPILQQMQAPTRGESENIFAADLTRKRSAFVRLRFILYLSPLLFSERTPSWRASRRASVAAGCRG